MLAEEMASLIKEEGRTITLTRVTSGSYSPAASSATVTNVEVNVKALLLDYNNRERDGTQIKAGDRKAVLKALGLTTPPKQDDLITVDSKSHKIVNVRTIENKGDPVVYVCQIRG